jgi:hypothetical protein
MYVCGKATEIFSSITPKPVVRNDIRSAAIKKSSIDSARQKIMKDNAKDCGGFVRALSRK